MAILKDKIALVTGASRGIGKAIAQSFSKEGATVIINYKQNQQEAKDVLQKIESTGGKAITIQADVSNKEQVKDMFSEIKKTFGELDILVNNAGIMKDNLIVNTLEEEWDATIDTNLKGTFYCLQQATKMMCLNGGKIINITSIVGVKGNPGQIAYCASKAGIIGMTKTAAKELGEIGITVNAIAPGLTDTSMISHLSDNQMSKYVNQTPLGRIAEPQEIANLATFLASESAKYINGQIIRIDGGMIM